MKGKEYLEIGGKRDKFALFVHCKMAACASAVEERNSTDSAPTKKYSWSEEET